MIQQQSGGKKLRGKRNDAFDMITQQIKVFELEFMKLLATENAPDLTDDIKFDTRIQFASSFISNFNL